MNQTKGGVVSLGRGKNQIISLVNGKQIVESYQNEIELITEEKTYYLQSIVLRQDYVWFKYNGYFTWLPIASTKIQVKVHHSEDS